MESEVKQLVSEGLWKAFASLECLKQWQPYTSLSPQPGLYPETKAMVLALKAALVAWKKTDSQDADAMTQLLALDTYRAKRVLNSPDGLREKAGFYYGVHHDQFRKVQEPRLVAAFADFLTTFTTKPTPPPEETTQLNFGDLEAASRDLHRKLEQQFVPDVVVTMSGPGSFAACYMMQYNTRDIPVVMAVTFPRRDVPSPVEQTFARAAMAADAIYLTTSKWSVYLPGLLRHLDPGTRVALVDDRVVSGGTQIEARRQLESFGLQVACSAMFTKGETPISDLIVGRELRGPFNMPWGSDRGRT